MLKMKKSIFIYIAIIAMIFITGCSSNSTSSSSAEGEKENNSSSEKETIKLSLASFVPTTHTFSVHGEQAFIERVTELTNGKVQFDHYPAGQMGAGPDLLGLTAKKAVDIAFVAPIYTPSEMKLGANLFGLPGLFESSYEGSMAYYKISHESPMLEEDFLNNGVRPLFTITAPPYDIYTIGKEVKVPSDLEGMRLKSAGGVYSEMLKFAGATPVTITVSDLFSALEKGVVDGMQSYHIDAEGYGVVELLENATNNLGFGAVAFGLAINEEVYQELPEEIQEALDQASLEITESLSRVYDSENIAVSERMAEQGINVYEVSGNEKEEWEKLYENFTEKMLGKSDNGSFNKVLEMFQQELDSIQ